MTPMIQQSWKIGLALSWLLIYMIFFANWAMAAQSVELREDHMIEDSYIRLGDVFTQTGPNADHVLAPTPAAGKDLVLGVSDLTRIAKAFHLDWAASSASEKIVLRRDAQLITTPMIKDALLSSNLDKKIHADFDIAFDDPTTSFTVIGGDVAALDLESVSYDPLTERFSASIIATRDGERLTTHHVTGYATKITKIPVFATRVTPGEVITTNHLAFVDVKTRDVNDNMVANAADIIGKTPRRMPILDKPILFSDVTEPLLVHRNEFVTVTLKKGPIRLSTKGRAMSQGARGEVVRIMNQESKTIIEAVVTGPQEAIVDQSI